MSRAFLGLGSNLGDRHAFLQGAVAFLAVADGLEVRAVSRVYESDPVGGPVQGDFLNAVVEVDTTLTPRSLLVVCQAAEANAARVRIERWGPRTLDVDILAMDGVAMDEPDLTIPHPRMKDRAFVLAPLHDLAPTLVAIPEGGWTGLRPVSAPLRISP